ncbi:hypothetical protein BLNAU_21016 [Blattamonas nauphoetae]|uniref:Uncharacterized protein n=1 Tax=Blattamonas nauphoetae TaxID=2049346 RepID=A0ABQ9WZB2_9EUKA|nr:hypothetical protein BLNAU_21016 [Blattamonas nauphoetae]
MDQPAGREPFKKEIEPEPDQRIFRTVSDFPWTTTTSRSMVATLSFSFVQDYPPNMTASEGLTRKGDEKGAQGNTAASSSAERQNIDTADLVTCHIVCTLIAIRA